MNDERITTNVRQSDILLRLMRWRARLERNHAATERGEAATRLVIVARAIDEIETLRRTVERQRSEREMLEQLVKGGGQRLRW